LATTGHKLQGMTKKYLIVASLNYSTANWIYVVLSRVTTLNGLFLLQPLKNNFNPQPSKLLKEEWKFQRTLEIETLLHLQQSGHFPSDIDVFRTTPEIPTTENENRIQIAKKLSTPVRKRAHSKKNKNGNMDVLDVELTTTLNNFDYGKLVCQKPLLFGDLNSPKILLWHYKEHYEQIIKIGVNI